MSSTTTTKTTKKVTVVKRSEGFYDDQFFEDNWGDFDNAMKQTIQKFETDKTPKIDFGNRNTCTDVYRKIRSDNIEKDLYQSQALQVTEKDGKFHCVMDVKDFTPNDLQVKVVDDRVVVEGKFEKKSEDGSSTSSKSFHKEFTLPSVADIEQISTALSKDGVLTIKAPKRDGDAPQPTSGPVQPANSNQTSSSVQETSSSSVTDDGNSSSSKTEKKFSSTSTSSSTFSSTKKVSMQSSTTSSFDTSNNAIE